MFNIANQFEQLISYRMQCNASRTALNQTRSPSLFHSIWNQIDHRICILPYWKKIQLNICSSDVLGFDTLQSVASSLLWKRFYSQGMQSWGNKDNIRLDVLCCFPMDILCGSTQSNLISCYRKYCMTLMHCLPKRPLHHFNYRSELSIILLILIEKVKFFLEKGKFLMIFMRCDLDGKTKIDDDWIS